MSSAGDVGKKKKAKKSKDSSAAVALLNSSMPSTAIVLPEEPSSKAKFLQQKPEISTLPGLIDQRLMKHAASVTKNRAALPAPAAPKGFVDKVASVVGPAAIVLADIWAETKPATKVLPDDKKLKSKSIVSSSVPAAGASYNPEVAAHQDAVGVAVAAEVAVERRRAGVMAKLAPQTGGDAAVMDWDQHDPDNSEDEGEGCSKRATGAPLVAAAQSASSSSAAVKPVKPRKLKGQAKRDADLALFDSQVAAGLGRGDNAGKISNKALKRQQKEEQRKAGSSVVVVDATTIPLSEELTGSLRSMKPLLSGHLLSSHLSALSNKGLVHGRKTLHAPVREDDDGRLIVNTDAQLNRVKGKGAPWRDVEFPRRKGFTPADEIAADAGIDSHGVTAFVRSRGKKGGKPK